MRFGLAFMPADRDLRVDDVPGLFEDELRRLPRRRGGGDRDPRVKLDGVDDVRGRLRESGLAASACLPAAGLILPSPLIPGSGGAGGAGRLDLRVGGAARGTGAVLRLLPTGPAGEPGDDREMVVEGIRRIADAGAGTACGWRWRLIDPSQAEVLVVGLGRSTRCWS